jgi:HTH-type transcriptional regulator / antitoxin HipB
VGDRRHPGRWPLADFGKMWSFTDITQTRNLAMRIRTPTDLGAIIRDSRLKLGLAQKSLADRIGVGREWIVEVEKGKPRAQIGLVLRAINALGIVLDARPETTLPKERSARAADTSVDIDSIVAAARKPRK